MKILTKKVQKMTSKGQITLPVSWRKKFDTNQVVVETEGEQIKITPFSFKEKCKCDEYTVFDAIRDNKGKGLRVDSLLSVLKKIDG